MRHPPVGARVCAESLRLDAIVPTLDEAPHVSALVERLLRGGNGVRDRVERVIVVDGGSSDGTPQLALAAGAEVLNGQRGRGSQLALGALHGSGEGLVFLHADCWPEPDAIARARGLLEHEPGAAGAFHQRIDAAGWFYRSVERWADRRVARRGMVYGDSGLVLRRATYERCGGFRPLRLFEDVDLSRRLRRVVRPRLIEGAVLRISGRRWRSEGALRATLRNWILRTAFEVGVAPATLVRFYPPHGAGDRS